MTKRIKKGDKTHIIAFCPQCSAGDPCIVNGEEEYTMMRIDTARRNEMLLQERKPKKSEGWMKRPNKILYYKDSLSMGDMYYKPLDGYQQSNKYDKKVVKYRQESCEVQTRKL
jgi:hypothetical protein